MKYLLNDIVTFRDTEFSTLNGVIIGFHKRELAYGIKGNNAKIYVVPEKNVLESIGKMSRNKNRAKAEEWEKTHGDYIMWEEAK